MPDSHAAAQFVVEVQFVSATTAEACAAGASNIEDITHLGSWLAYLERQQQQQQQQLGMEQQQ